MKTERVKYAQHVEDGERLHQFAVDLHLEGVMAKRLNSIYQAGRSKDWIKVKTATGRERERKRFVIRGRSGSPSALFVHDECMILDRPEV